MVKIIVIGGGAAGMMAAISASNKNENEIILLEKNEKLGKKIYITGKGRCNVTNACEDQDFFNSIFASKKFFYSAFYTFNNDQLVEMLNANGLKTKVERGQRVFPLSDKSSDVIKTLSNIIKSKKNIEVRLNTSAKDILVEDDKVTGVLLVDGDILHSDSVILAPGGLSYPSTGSTGDFYSIVEKLGHKITPTSPALTGMLSKDKWVESLSGLTLKNIDATLYNQGKKIKNEFGELLFTHKGISGPVVLTMSCHISEFKDAYVLIDLKPALDRDTLDKRILRDFSENINRAFKNSLDQLLPKSLAEVIVELSGIDPDKKVNQITTVERQALVSLVKGLKINVYSLCGYNEAIITKGGVSVKDIDPSTMMSKKVDGLFFAGEMIDLHGYTGGYNLQLAFSTGYLAGENA